MQGASMIAALAVSVFGCLGTVAGAFLAQTTGPGADLGPWVSGGSASIAVGALVYMARMLTTGRLVSRDTAAEIAKLAELVERVTAALEQSAERERSLYRLVQRKEHG